MSLISRPWPLDSRHDRASFFNEIEAQQQRLLQASRLAAVGELAAGVAHEVNNPATTILTRATFLLSADETRSESDREDLQAIVDQSERIAQVTRSLLMFSRPERLQLRPVAVERLVHGSLRSVDRLLSANGIAVETDLEPSLPLVLADESSLSRALENIIRNAIDAMPGGGVLRVRAHRESGSWVCVEISDTGIGIDAPRIPRLFDPFFTTKEPGKGTGLGLSIAHGIVSEHCGQISVESTPGKGSEFIIMLPAEQSA